MLAEAELICRNGTNKYTEELAEIEIAVATYPIPCTLAFCPHFKTWSWIIVAQEAR